MDIGCEGGVDNAANDIKIIEKELHAFGRGLVDRPRWIVLNKTDLVLAEEADEFLSELKKKLATDRPVYLISAVTGAGCKELAQVIFQWVEENQQAGSQENSRENVQENFDNV